MISSVLVWALAILLVFFMYLAGKYHGEIEFKDRQIELLKERRLCLKEDNKKLKDENINLRLRLGRLKLVKS